MELATGVEFVAPHTAAVGVDVDVVDDGQIVQEPEVLEVVATAEPVEQL